MVLDDDHVSVLQLQGEKLGHLFEIKSSPTVVNPVSESLASN